MTLPFLILLVALRAAAVAPPALGPSDAGAIMKVLCEDKLKKDEKGWVCVSPPTEEGGPPVERRWLMARSGRFVAHPDEWLVGLDLGCDRGCEGETHVLRKVGGAWRRTHAIELYVPLGANCVPFGGMPDGLDRLVCQGASGPHQGFMFERVIAISFAGGEATEHRLLEKSQGGECFLDPPGAAHHEDAVTIQRERPTDPAVAFTVGLEVRRAPCVGPTNDDWHGPIVTKGRHVLRFRRKGNDVVPDAASAKILEAEGWAPEAAGQ